MGLGGQIERPGLFGLVMEEEGRIVAFVEELENRGEDLWDLVGEGEAGWRGEGVG